MAIVAQSENNFKIKSNKCTLLHVQLLGLLSNISILDNNPNNIFL